MNNLTTDPNTKLRQKYADRNKHISTQTLVLLNKPIWAKSDTNIHIHYISHPNSHTKTHSHTDKHWKSNTPQHTQNLTNAWLNTPMRSHIQYSQFYSINNQSQNVVCKGDILHVRLSTVEYVSNEGGSSLEFNSWGISSNSYDRKR
jgi:hypothetical protein